MIDIENELFNQIATKLRNKFNSISVYGEYIKSPAVFPAVFIEERGNNVYERTQDSGNIENHARLMYEVNVYSNKQIGKKSECKKIFEVIDNEFASMGFTRILKEPIANLEDASIYRMVGRYTGVISTNKTIYRR
jgi:phenylalanyl-tRNA synthetase alpha subunit